MKNLVLSVLAFFFTVCTLSAQNKSFNLNDLPAGSFKSKSIPGNITTPIFQNASKSRELIINPIIQNSKSIHVNDTILLDLFENKQYKAYIDKIDVDVNGTTTIRTRLLDSDYGYCVISTFNGKSFMTVEVPQKNELYMSKYDQKTKKYYLLQIDKSKQKALDGAPSLIPPMINQPTNYQPSINPPTNNLPFNYPPTNQLPINKKQTINPQTNNLPFNYLPPNYSTINTPQNIDNPNAWPNTKIGSGNIAKSQSLVSDPYTRDTITLMIVYTPAAEAWSAANETDINNTISLLMAKAQLALDNSNTLMTIKLVYTGELNYTELNNSNDLYNLTVIGNGQIDEVHNWRDAYNADLVVLLENMDFAGGLGWLLDSNSGLPDYAFSINRVQQASWTYSTIHEIAHNMGCHHHKTQILEPGPGLFSYSAGWRWNGSDGIKYCDVMTYESGSNFADGINATTVPYFSNPNIQYQGVPTGNSADGDNARTIREMKSVAAAYRTGYNTYTSPTIQATNFTASSITDSSMTIGWTRGSGNSVMVVARQKNTPTQFPVNETVYSANAAFGNGAEIGSRNYVVYNGLGTSANITFLSSGTNYNFDIYEYNSISNCYLKSALSGTAITTGNPPGNSVADSLALVALYNKCGGLNWTRKANWLTGPLNTWQDISVENGRVVELFQGDHWRSLPSAGLTGAIPSELTNLSELRLLDLSNNQLTGILPESWSALLKLKILYLSFNQLTGKLPENWSSLVNLEQLVLSSNDLTGTLPASWSAFVKLKVLYLPDNQLIGTLPESWSTMLSLQDLRLVSNQLSGSLPESWKALSNMKILILSDNQFTGTLPSNWSEFKNLQYLWISANQFTGSLPVSWSDLVSLQSTDLQMNQLTGTLPESWSALVNLQHLFLGGNDFSGNLPISWSHLINLQKLSLGPISGTHNASRLKGSLPDSWSEMKNLRFLAITDTDITGPLPASWSALVNLEQLGFGFNQLTGPLPESWSALTNLWFISFMSNKLTGPLPESWFTLENLQELYLAGNQITGTVPASWSACSKLSLIDFSDNQLVGEVPQSWQSLINLNTLGLSSNQISGLPNFSSFTNLNDFYVNNNMLDFGDIEPNIGIAKVMFQYVNQATVGLADTIIREQGEEFRISVSIGGKSNKYQWTKNGVNISGATGAEYVISSVIPGDAGVYVCQITNTVATELIMTCQPITLQIISHLTANAGPDQSVYESAPVTLDGSSSSASEDKSLTYKWTSPAGIILNSTTIEKPTFTAPEVNAETAFKFFLVVNDGGIDSPADQVVVTVKDFNNKPIANAGMDKSECEGMIASLDGSTSLDQFGKLLIYKWTAPAGIILSSTTIANPTFTAPEVSANTNFTFSLVVNNGNVDSPADEVLITVLKCSNQRQQDSLALVALYNATDGPNWTKKNNWLTGSLNTWEGVIVENGRVTYLFANSSGLKGQLPSEISSLSEIRMINFFNNKLKGPLPDSWSALVKLQGIYLEVNQFTGPLPESWSALEQLIFLYLGGNKLSGNLPESWKSLVNLQSLFVANNQISGLPNFSSLTNLSDLMVQNNLLDFGDIEPNIGVPKNSYNYTPQTLIGVQSSIIKNLGQEFRISVTVGGNSNKYQWYKNAASFIGATGPEFVIPSVTSGDAGVYTCQITNTVATELTLTSQPVTLQIANQVPVANAGADQSVNENTMVALDGSASSDGDNTILTYRWTAPTGITLSSATAAKPTFTAPEVTINTNYTFSLIVNDGTADSPADQVVITVNQVNKVPVANAGSDQSVNENTVVTLDSSTSSDGDNNILTYKWTAPTGIILSSAIAAKPTFMAPEVTINTNYTFSLIVNDGTADSPADQVVITVRQVNKVPVANAGSEQLADENTVITLDGSASYDQDGNLLTYQWTSPAGILLSSSIIVNPTFTVPQVTQDTILIFSLIVNDGFVNSQLSTVKISVQNVIYTGLEIITSNGLKIYPNPSKGIFKIEGLPSNQKTEIFIYSIDGKIIFKKITNSITENIDISDQVTGTYILFIDKKTFKIRKE